MSYGQASQESSESITLGALPSAPESKSPAPVTTARAWRWSTQPARRLFLARTGLEQAHPDRVDLASVAPSVRQLALRLSDAPRTRVSGQLQPRANAPWLPSHELAYIRAGSLLRPQLYPAIHPRQPATIPAS